LEGAPVFYPEPYTLLGTDKHGQPKHHRDERPCVYPASLTIVKAAKVTWMNDDSTTHTVTSDTGAFESGNLSPGNSFTHQFNDAGTFPYHCSIHTFMKGTVTVQ
jgi:plastocyanin